MFISSSGTRDAIIAAEDLPQNSIALGSIVRRPVLDTVERKYSFGHFGHHDRFRRVMRATCEQVFDLLLLGFTPKGSETIYINDATGDIALAIWLLKHRDRADEPLVRDLVHIVSKIECHGPAYPLREHEKSLADRFFNEALRALEDLRGNTWYQEVKMEQEALEESYGRSILGRFFRALNVPLEDLRREAAELEERAIAESLKGISAMLAAPEREPVITA